MGKGVEDEGAWFPGGMWNRGLVSALGVEGQQRAQWRRGWGQSWHLHVILESRLFVLDACHRSPPPQFLRYQMEVTWQLMSLSAQFHPGSAK